MNKFLRVGALGWNDLVALESNLEDRWIFRGQSNSSWPLQSSLERAFSQYDCSLEARRYAEVCMVREFQRTAHRYSDSLPRYTQYFDWLAMMQHHGAPTRMVDFSYSFYIAAFFACQRISEESSIWALNLTKLLKLLKNMGVNQLSEPSEIGWAEVYNQLDVWGREQFLTDEPVNAVIPLEPLRKIERLDVQQGLFLCPANIKYSFMQALGNLLGLEEEIFLDKSAPFVYSNDETLGLTLNSTILVKIDIKRAIQLQALRYLQKVNINDASLFPGIDGFSRSLIRFADDQSIKELEERYDGKANKYPSFKKVIQST